MEDEMRHRVGGAPEEGVRVDGSDDHDELDQAIGDALEENGRSYGQV